MCVGLRQRSSDRWSKLAAAPRCEAEADISRCVLVSAAGGTPTRHLHVCVCIWRRSSHAKWHLMEQACICSMVRGGGGLKVQYTLVSITGTPTTHCKCVFAFGDGANMRRSGRWSKFADAVWCEVEADKVRACLCRRWHSNQAPACVCLPTELSCEAAPGGASLRLLHDARWRRTQGACSSLPQAALQPRTCMCICLW